MKRHVRSGAAFVIWCLLLLGVSSCIDRFEPEVKGPAQNFLVVDGFLNSSGVTTIKLTRALTLQAATAPPVEARAKVFIEEENGQHYALTESPAGTYTSAALRLNASKRHRLQFTTTTGKEYTSDYTVVKITPPIDAVSWKIDNDEVRIGVSTHDAANTTHYYRWDAEETWEFTAPYRSAIELINGRIQARTNNIYRCWVTEKLGAIRLGNTTRLSQDIVADAPLISLPNTSVKLGYKYSVLVREYAQTAEEFAYWEALRKNTENIGTLFDALPTQLTGNVHCTTDATELVMGFVGAYSVTEKRIFIRYTDLPSTWTFASGYDKCPKPDIIEPSMAGNVFQSANYLPIETIYNDNGSVRAYTGLAAECVDCRLKGSNVQPVFW
jgi:hypothetical protein